MALDDQTSQEQLTPDERRTMLRAFADRMLVKVSAMDDPEDLPGVERAMRTAAVIERIYSRCDRAERQAPDLNRIEADRARNLCDALKNRHNLITTLDWAQERRKGHGVKWDAVQHHVRPKHTIPAPVRIPASVTKVKIAQAAPQTAPVPSATAAKTEARAAPLAKTPLPGLPQTPPKTPQVTVTDMTDAIHAWRAEMGLPDMSAYYAEPDPPGKSTAPP